MDTEQLRQELKVAIHEFAEAFTAERNKGGGDPASYAELERNLEIADEKIDNLLSLIRFRGKR